jgi:phosphonate transport system permease protein
MQSKGYYAGFIRPKPRWIDVLGVFKTRVAIFLTDIVLFFYLLIIGSYCFSQIVYGEERFLLSPWWVIPVLVVELALLWETFGVSVGMKLAGIRLLTLDGRAPSSRRRVLRFVIWHLLALPLVGSLAILWDRDRLAWQDRLSGTKLVKGEKEAAVRTPWYRTPHGIAVAAALALTLVAAGYITEVNLHALFSGASRAGIVVNRLVRPDWSILGTGINLLVITIFMAFMATLFGVICAVPLSFLAARNLTQGVIGRTVYIIVRTVMSITRSIEPIIWAIIFVVWVRLGTFPGMLALWVHSIADLTKLYSERLEAIDPGPVEAIRATGAGRLQVILYGIVPQIINPYLSFTLYRWDINVRMATIIGIVGGGGIGQRLYASTRYWQWNQAGTLMVLIILTVSAIDYLSSRLRESLE